MVGVVKIGFTGTQNGMSGPQLIKLNEAFEKIVASVGPGEFHHGDCVGADSEAATLARSHGFRIIGHPPTVYDKRAFFASDFDHMPLPYLKRNHVIVEMTDKLLVAPKTLTEERRSGTWATFRYAMKLGKSMTIFYPNGVVE